MVASEFPLPDVGEGLTEAEIVSWKVAPGDSVTVNQVLVEIETAKSLVELPSPFAGTVQELLVDEGATVEVGTPIIRVASSGGSIELQAAGAGESDFVAPLDTTDRSVPQHVVTGHLAGGPAGRDVGEVDAEVAGELADRGLRDDADG